MILFLLSALFLFSNPFLTSTAADTLLADTTEVTTAPEISDMDILLMQLGEIERELQALRTDIAGASEESLIGINDRMGVLEQRILALDSRIERLHGEVGNIDLNFTLIVFLIIAVGFLTIAAVFIQRKKFVDPLSDRVRKFDDDLSKIDADKSERLTDTLRELGENDPKVAQLLRKHNLD